ncbi:MAG TPA: histidine phosphatase family protein [Myxococcaceae bacterium]|nr:histidine phosphatase family protein [Myxococcaceae bacterium]
MKTLHLLRHAKSDWNVPDLPDEKRPLNGRGRRDARNLGRHLEKHPIDAQMVLSSPALRARQTLEAILPALAGTVSSADAAIYAATADQLLDLVRRKPKAIRSLLLVGHNPGFEDLASLLLPADDAPGSLPTCTLATVTFEGEDWSAIGPGRGHLVSFIKPPDFTA